MFKGNAKKNHESLNKIKLWKYSIFYSAHVILFWNGVNYKNVSSCLIFFINKILSSYIQIVFMLNDYKIDTPNRYISQKNIIL